MARNHRITAVLFFLLTFSTGFAQSKPETIANFSLRAFDAAQTCYYMHTEPRGREMWLPTQSCAGVAAWDGGFAFAAFFGDRWLAKHNHPRLAHFQIVSGASASVGIAYSFTHVH